MKEKKEEVMEEEMVEGKEEEAEEKSKLRFPPNNTILRLNRKR